MLLFFVALLGMLLFPPNRRVRAEGEVKVQGNSQNPGPLDGENALELVVVGIFLFILGMWAC